MIIDAIRQEQMREVMDLEKSNRYAVSFQNRIFKGIQMMGALAQHEVMAAQMHNHLASDGDQVVDEEDPKEWLSKRACLQNKQARFLPMLRIEANF